MGINGYFVCELGIPTDRSDRLQQSEICFLAATVEDQSLIAVWHPSCTLSLAGTSKDATIILSVIEGSSVLRETEDRVDRVSYFGSVRSPVALIAPNQNRMPHWPQRKSYGLKKKLCSARIKKGLGKASSLLNPSKRLTTGSLSNRRKHAS